MTKEYIGDGVEYIEGNSGTGRYQRKLTDKDKEKLKKYLSKPDVPDYEGISPIERFIMYSLLWLGVSNLESIMGFLWRNFDFEEGLLKLGGKRFPLPEEVNIRLKELHESCLPNCTDKIFQQLPEIFDPFLFQTMLDIDCQNSGVKIFGKNR